MRGRDSHDTKKGTPFRQVRPLSQPGFVTMTVRSWRGST
jgi:hypothetical protein